MKTIYAHSILLFLLAAPLPALASITISEVAWMGSSSSYYDEWIELYNSGSSAVSLEGYTLRAADGSPDIALEGTIAPGAYALLERTDDASAPEVSALYIYAGALGNSGETLILKDASGVEIDRVDGADGWSIGGDNDTKETLQRSGGAWYTAERTPGAPYSGASSATTQTEEEENTKVKEQSPKTYPIQDALQYEVAPSFSVEVVGPEVIASGATGRFKGEAVGKRGERIQESEVRWRWSFGDGEVVHGKQVTHHFRYPGEYMVVLSISNEGTYESAHDRHRVSVREPLIALTEANPLFVEIRNTDSAALDLSHWYLSDGENYFTIPEETYILPEQSVRFAAEVTKLSGGADTALLFPNTTTAAEYRVEMLEQELSKRSASTVPIGEEQIPQVLSYQSGTPPTAKEREKTAAVEDDTKEEYPSTVAAVAAAPEEEGWYVWLFALLGVLGVSVALLMLRPKEESEAERYSVEESDTR